MFFFLQRYPCVCGGDSYAVSSVSPPRQNERLFVRGTGLFFRSYFGTISLALMEQLEERVAQLEKRLALVERALVSSLDSGESVQSFRESMRQLGRAEAQKGEGLNIGLAVES